ncbi:sca1 complex scaffold protein scaa [Anaeramoeba flamelloides]|uniref:Sca1 complex scaffold protein scaa n=1 Tax=Anaeramoeba flamelloides TaxID=1746091 RepID=A0ABQ8ZFI7_9EUKA|nr:sca1 complex scaffold protein scaa [Anaeramoeba flamelloides]
MKTQNSVPIFLDSKGNFLNKHYHSLNKEEKETNIKEILDKLPEFPRVSQSANYLEFEKAALEWKKQVDLLTKNVVLPNTTGKNFYRPIYHEKYEENPLITRDTRSENSSNDTTSRGSDSFGRISETSSRGSSIFNSPKIEKELSSEALNSQSKSQRKEIENKKYLQKRENLTEFLMDTESIMTSSQPWNNTLIPGEPQPEYYESLEEFEEAYHRWNKIVIESTEKIPPHAQEFETIHNILTKKAKQEQEEQRTKMKLEQRLKNQIKSNDDNDKNSKGFYNERNLYNTSIYGTQYQYDMGKLHKRNSKNIPSYNLDALDKLKKEVYNKGLFQLSKFNFRSFDNLSLCHDKGGHNEVNYLEYHTPDYASYYETKREFNPNFLATYYTVEKETLDKIKNSLGDQFKFVSLKKKINELDFKTKRVLGKLHGTYKTVNQRLKKSKSKTLIPIETQYLRRNDLDEMDLQKGSYDCDQQLENKKILFIYPTYDDSEPINLKLLQQQDTNYINQRISTLKSIDKESKNKFLNSSYYPKQFTDNKITTQKYNIEEIIKDNLIFSPAEKLYQIILSDICYDTFVDLMSEDIFIQTNKAISEVIYSLINYNVLGALVKLYDYSSSRLVHAKLTFLLTGILETSKGVHILQKCLQLQDYNCLYYLAYAMNFKENKQNSIFPIPLEACEYSKMLFGKDYFQVEKNIFIYDFLQMITNPMNLPSNKLLYFAVSKQIKQFVDISSQSFSQIPENNVEFLSTDVWTGLFSRSIEISNYYLYIILTLIRGEKQEIYNFLLSKKDNDFLKKQLNLEKTDNNNNNNNKNKNNTNNKNICNNNNNIHNNNHNNKFIKKENLSEISYFCFNLIKLQAKKLNSIQLHKHSKNSFRKKGNKSKKTKDHDIIFLKPSIINALINLLFDFIVNKKINHPILEITSKLLSLLSKILPLWTWLEAKIKGKEIKIRSYQTFENRKTIIITGEFLQKILTTIKSTPNENDRTKKNLIAFLTNIIKCPQIFELIKTQDKFFSQFYSITRSSNSVRLSKKTWKFLYQLILFNPDSINFLIEKKKFNGFLGLISSSSTIPVVTYGLDFLFKCFSLLETNFEKKFSSIKEIDYRSDQNPIDKIEKIHNIFVNFFTDFSMFVKLNMVFMKYGKQYQGRNINWFVIIKLAQVYFIVLSKNFCSKILKDNYKKDQYQEGFKFFESIMLDQRNSLDSIENSKIKKKKSVNFTKNNKEEKKKKKKFLSKTLKKGSFRKWLKKN